MTESGLQSAPYLVNNAKISMTPQYAFAKLLFEFFDIFIFSLSSWVCDPHFMLIFSPVPELWRVLQRRDFNQNLEMKNKPMWILPYICTLSWVSHQLLVYNECLVKVKKAVRVFSFWRCLRNIVWSVFQKSRKTIRATFFT